MQAGWRAQLAAQEEGEVLRRVREVRPGWSMSGWRAYPRITEPQVWSGGVAGLWPQGSHASASSKGLEIDTFVMSRQVWILSRWVTP